MVQFLDKLKDFGFNELVGVEPSINVINVASSRIKENIQIGMSDSSKFSANSFDLIIICQMLEHLINHMEMLKDIYQLLKPGGWFS